MCVLPQLHAVVYVDVLNAVTLNGGVIFRPLKVNAAGNAGHNHVKACLLGMEAQTDLSKYQS